MNNDTDDIRPPYRTALLIRRVGPLLGGFRVAEI